MWLIVIYDVSESKRNVANILPSFLIADPDKELYAEIPDVERIAWIWALVFALTVPEVGTLIRAARICFFRNVRKSPWNELLLVYV